MATILSQSVNRIGADELHGSGRLAPSLFKEARASEMLISALAHDLRAPLRNIRQLTRSLAEEFSDMTSASTELLRLNKLVEKTSRMVDDLLLSRRSAYRSEAYELVRLNDMVQDSVDLGPMPCDVSIEVTGEIKQFLTAKAELALVMRNVIGNAIRHHDRVHGTVTIGASFQTPDMIEFLVCDDGPGLSQEMLGWLTSARHRSTHGHTASLGLILAVTMVRRHGGEICAASGMSDGRGTEIRWSWPAQLQEISHGGRL